MITVSQTEQLRAERKLWLTKNRGILSRIAEELDYTPGFVRLVFYGGTVSTKGDIEKALIATGAPGWSQEVAA